MTQENDVQAVSFSAAIERFRKAADELRLRVLRDDCPRCESPRDELATTCVANDMDWCKHRDAIDAIRADAALTETRRKRMAEAPIHNAALVQQFAPLRVPPDARAQLPANATREQIEAARLPMRWASRLLEPKAPRNALFCGHAGSGKTWAAAWVVAGSDDARWLTFTATAPTQEWSDLRREVLRARTLVINDMGSGPVVGWRDAEIEGLVVERDDIGKRTIVTTNLSVEEVRARFGDRLHRRLTGRDSVVVPCVGPDLSAVLR